MRTVNMLEAKTNLSKLVQAVESGAEDEIVIARNGKPAVRLMAMAQPKKGGFKIGIGKGKFKLPDNYEEINQQLDKEIEDLFYAEPIFPPE
jgi:prevent-host-death family protein